MKDICCIGHITHDRIITPRRTVDMAGGTAFYFAYGINRLPKTVSFELVTKVGDDALGEVGKMRKAGIEVVASHSRKTVCFENKYGENANHRTQRVLAEADGFTLEEVRPLEARVFHLGPLLKGDFPTEVVRTLKAKALVSIDIQGYLREVREKKVVAAEWKEKEAVLRLTDIVKLNQYEMATVSLLTDPRSVARELAGYGIREVLLTFGSEGSLILKDGVFHEIPAYAPRALIDATGCGDTYACGYLYCRMQGMTPLEAGKFAAAMCTRKLEHSGPFAGTLSDIHDIIG
ncbi:PfkB family carbohydrate kinase [Prevotella sp. KH2C16]|uniref:PfkB family carbohydrate kinase n=1 Tax=Prevotella sp. KH2C16 TaxID=1855325 RepID=UPI0008E0FADF|nr:PfkB family carbohydrate kinase [Prevotella sp. KH2C16]SFG64190.1 Sugar or nucleoside kinase, ribokinase family [Prevotella sp. KH2C16]